jgi:penicillin-binding protein 2
VYERRLKILLALMVGVILIVLGRLVQLQVLWGDRLGERARELLTYVELLQTVRGRVLDRAGRPLAQDEPCYDLCFDYPMLLGPDAGPDDGALYRRWAARQQRRIREAEGLSRERAAEVFEQRLREGWLLAAELTRPPADRAGASAPAGGGADPDARLDAHLQEMSDAAADAVHRVERIREIIGGPPWEQTQPHPIVTELDEATAVAVRERLDEIVGASIEPSHRRAYPRGHDACHIVGILGPVSEAEQPRAPGDDSIPLKRKLAGYIYGDRIGRTGVEKACEDILRGTRGYRRLQRTGKLIEKDPPTLGRDVHLTLDVELQRALAELLGRPGAIVVLDVDTGEVLAAVSTPTFDPNRYAEDVADLQADQLRLPLWNRATAVRYPPGSTCKPLAAVASLAEGRIGAGTTFHCRGYMHQPTAFRCWIFKYGHGHGSLDVVGAIENSCNVFFYHVGERLGVRRQVRWFGEEFGFARKPGTGLPDERAGLLPDPAEVRTAGEARFLAIGQGRITVTPMHVANAMATIARGGTFLSPLLIRERSGEQVRHELPVSDRTISLVQKGMYRVVASGTARKHARDPEIEICGKTGTAQTAPRRRGIDDDGDGLPDRWGQVLASVDTAWFAGFAPYRWPKIAFVVMVEYSDAGGGATCGPIARQLVRICRAFGYL